MFLVGADFVTPLKKRRLARESISQDGSMPGITEEDEPGVKASSPAGADIPPVGADHLLDSSSNSRDTTLWTQVYYIIII